MISLKNVSFSYKNQSHPVLDGINLEVSPGESCALVGPSGCGKSTLLRLIGGIHREYQGEILVNGQRVDPKTRTIAFIQQDYGLLDWITVYKNATMGLRIKGQKPETYKGKAMELLTTLGIDHLANKYPNQLSGGERQRTAIAQALLLDSDILLMDEPFSALDAITGEKLQDIFMELWRTKAPASIFVTHSIEEAIILGRRIAIMSACPGKIDAVFDNPLFGGKNLRSSPEFYRFTLELREEVAKIWN